ncbi:MAG: alpha/beta hydrolase [Oscillatoriophycideae cyanobacterium NC_groundwater_1537_Pr4_S-0.65um_50_18]|nr:alpha/beta hydrolase [Oscillatoriophycideae cyanobacterium NC_groundwater_1537_Pr4_S-0.65um_50_18]
MPESIIIMEWYTPHCIEKYYRNIARFTSAHSTSQLNQLNQSVKPGSQTLMGGVFNQPPFSAPEPPCAPDKEIQGKDKTFPRYALISAVLTHFVALFSKMPVNLLCPSQILRVLAVYLASKSALYRGFWLSALCIALSIGFAPAPAQAAEQLLVRLGPLQQSVAIADLERFAKTGDVPSSLSLYTPLLTAEVRQLLDSSLQLEPNVGDKLVEDLLHSSAGERFLNTLQAAMPKTTTVELKSALAQAALRPEGMSLLGVLRSFPSKTLLIDATSAIALVSQMNLPAWQSQTLSGVLDRELTVASKPQRQSFDPTQTGPYWVWKQSLTLRDYERDRTIPVDLYWSRKTQGSLVVISHGFGADRRFLSYLAHHLTSYGLTVVALEHPASNVAWLTSAKLDQPNNILPASEFVDRPKDVSFVLDRLSRLNRFSDRLRGKFNTHQVSLIGHSLGGYTALALAGAPLSLKSLRQFCDDPNPMAFSPADLLQCNAADLPDSEVKLRDERIVQAIVLNPIIGRLFDEASLAQVTIPMLMLAGTEDAITPAVSQQFIPFTKLKNDKLLLTAIGASHLSVGDPSNLNRAITQSIFVRERPDQQTEALRELLKAISLAFIEQMTPQAKRYAPFLTSGYAQSFSTPDLKLRLNANLPPNFSNWLKMAALPMEQLVSTTLSQRSAEQSCDRSLSCLWNPLPLVMFILPGGLPVAAKHILKLSKRRRAKQMK